MKLSRWVVLLLLALVSRVQAGEEGVPALDAAWAKAMKANAIDQLMACYATNAVGWFPGTPEAKGAKAIRAGYEGIFGGNTVIDAGQSDTHYTKAGKLSVGWSKYFITAVEKATGKTNVWSGRFTEVAEKREGRWVYVIDHASAEPSPSASKP